MSIEQEITRLVDAKAAFKSWLTAKGVSVPKDALLPSMVDLLERVPAGGEIEPADITVSNHTATAFTAYGPDGSVSVPGESDVEMTSVVGGMIHLSCLRKNRSYAAMPGEVVSSSASGAYLNIAGKDYNTIDNYFACIGKPLTAVSAINVGGKPALYDEGTVSVYSEPLILWFEDKPLVVSCYTDFVVNPVYADDKKNDLTDVTTAFSSLIGTVLKEVQYIGTTICYFEFSNGKRLFFASRDIGDRKRVGSFDILADSKKVNVEELRIESFCAISGRTFASTITEYSEDSIALFCDDAAYLLYLRPGTAGKYQFGICPCTKELLTEYTRQYPLQQPAKTTWIYDQNNLSAVRLDFPEGHLYMAATEYYDIEIQFSDKIYNPLDYNVLPRKEGKHMEFLKRKVGD